MSQFFTRTSASAIVDDLTIVTNDGNASPSSETLNLQNTGTTVDFSGSGNTVTQDFAITNLLMGTDGAITTGLANVGYGLNALANVTSGVENIGVGQQAGISLTVGNENVLVGNNAGVNITGAGQNTYVGNDAGQGITAGSNNVFIGHNTGNSYTTASNNICIGVGTTGAGTESNTTRIGNNQNACFIDGIESVTVGSSAPVAVSSTNQLSSLGFGTIDQVLTSNGAGASPTWQNPVTANTENSFVDSGSAVVLTDATPANVTSITIGTGTWSISGLVQFTQTSALTLTGPQQMSISTTSATHGTIGNGSVQNSYLPDFDAGDIFITNPGFLVTVGSPSSVFLVASGNFSAGGMSAYGRITAIRVA